MSQETFSLGAFYAHLTANPALLGNHPSHEQMKWLEGQVGLLPPVIQNTLNADERFWTSGFSIHGPSDILVADICRLSPKNIAYPPKYLPPIPLGNPLYAEKPSLTEEDRRSYAFLFSNLEETVFGMMLEKVFPPPHYQDVPYLPLSLRVQAFLTFSDTDHINKYLDYLRDRGILTATGVLPKSPQGTMSPDEKRWYRYFLVCYSNDNRDNFIDNLACALSIPHYFMPSNTAPNSVRIDALLEYATLESLEKSLLKLTPSDGFEDPRVYHLAQEFYNFIAYNRRFPDEGDAKVDLEEIPERLKPALYSLARNALDLSQKCLREFYLKPEQDPTFRIRDWLPSKLSQACSVYHRETQNYYQDNSRTISPYYALVVRAFLSHVYEDLKEVNEEYNQPDQNRSLYNPLAVQMMGLTQLKRDLEFEQNRRS